MKRPLRVSYVLPVIDETVALRATVKVLFQLAGDSVHEIIVVVAGATTSASLSVVSELAQRWSGRMRVHKQRLSGLGGALREAFGLARGDYVMLMASDCETDPAVIPRFLAKMEEGKWDIICGSRWVAGGGFRGYGRMKVVFNWLFQKMCKLLYRTALTDLTFGYRLYRRSVLAGVPWQELDHPFLLESLLRPLLSGARVTEIPCIWQPRLEGVSHSSFRKYFRYLAVAWRMRWVVSSRLHR